MFDIKRIREDPEAFDGALKRRDPNALPMAVKLIELDDQRRAAVHAMNEAQQAQNAASKAIGQAKAGGEIARAEEMLAEVGELKSVVQEREEAARSAEQALTDAMAVLPNQLHPSVPDGKNPEDNPERSRHGEQPKFDFEPKEHFELGEALGMMDFETAAKMSGARFVVLRGELARLERALGQFMLDVQTTENGFEETQTPLLVNRDALFGSGQLPKFAADVFRTEKSRRLEDLDADLKAEFERRSNLAKRKEALPEDTDEFLERAKKRLELWLIPTAEVPLANLVREQILDEAELPRRVTALTPCFRAEAGAAGKDTRGMIRQHQFDKVELVAVTRPEDSDDEHQRMLGYAEEVLKRLGLHYRVVELCAGDMGATMARTFDIEVWLPGQGAYREISSVSTAGDWQARRMNARYRTKDGAVEFVHTLNGSGVAVGRALVAVMETFQNADGSITVPEVLRDRMGGLERIEPPRKDAKKAST